MVNEAIKEKSFDIIIHGDVYTMNRGHTIAKRGSSPMSRDAWMSKLKYTKLFNSFKINKTSLKQAIVFRTDNVYSYIVFALKDNNINIVTSVLKQKSNKSEEKVITRLKNHDECNIVHKGKLDMLEINESKFGDIVLSYRIIKDISTKWTDFDAYNLGLIDKEGTKLKSPESKEEKDAYNSYYKVIFNLKRILQRFVGKSNLAQSVVSLFLLKEGLTKRGTDLICEKLSIVDFKEVSNLDKDYIEALVESYIIDELDEVYDIKVNNKKVIFNKNKTDDDFIDRIQKRINILDKVDLDKRIERGLNKAYDKSSDKGHTCIAFTSSEFYIVYDKNSNTIITIYDGKWKRMPNKCKLVLVNEYVEDYMIIYNGSIDTEKTYNSLKYDINENYDLLLETDCVKCVEVNL